MYLQEVECRIVGRSKTGQAVEIRHKSHPFLPFLGRNHFGLFVSKIFNQIMQRKAEAESTSRYGSGSATLCKKLSEGCV
jgi:hypothetical protein